MQIAAFPMWPHFVTVGYKFDASSVKYVDNSALTFHRITEAFKHAYAQRTLLGDNDVGSDAFKTFVQDVSMYMHFEYEHR